MKRYYAIFHCVFYGSPQGTGQGARCVARAYSQRHARQIASALNKIAVTATGRRSAAQAELAQPAQANPTGGAPVKPGRGENAVDLSTSGQSKITVALAGNPNSGKTTLFNNLTGARQHVGNYPGVTVEKKEGACRFLGVDIEVVDLPGAYSLTAFSPEEMVVRSVLLETPPDVVISVLDASNLERNLYLAVQLLELQVPLVFACNMMDVLETRGDHLDLAELSRKLGAPVVPTVGTKRQGMDELLTQVLKVAKSHARPSLPVYSAGFEEVLGAIETKIAADARNANQPFRWTAVKLLENDQAVINDWSRSTALGVAKQYGIDLAARHDEAIETLVAQERYNYIAGICEAAVQPSATSRLSFSDRLDAVLTHRVWACPSSCWRCFWSF